jgi:alkanesulfonate monooxygenase SsuD/methylene tetrahydromethanopterin reductase-like flavin-dependent oxidoreductase (luciferase family)
VADVLAARVERSGILISSSVLLDATSQMNVASGIAQICARHPATTAAAHKTLFEAHEGRFLFGLGVAHAPRWRESASSIT